MTNNYTDYELKTQDKTYAKLYEKYKKVFPNLKKRGMK